MLARTPERGIRVTAIAADYLCGFVRFLVPLRAMVEQDLCYGEVQFPSNVVSDTPVTSGSPLLVQRERNLTPPVYAQVRQMGCRIVHDIDDMLWDIPADNYAHQFMPPEAKEIMFAAMREADVVTVSTEPLRIGLERLGIASVVVPNVLPAADWERLQPPREPRAKPRVGWQGQRSVHNADLAVLDTVIRALADEVQWVFFGEMPPSLADLYARFEYHPPVSLHLFPAMLARLDLDLMLSPLSLSPFNEAKSNLRALQAGALGYPVVATDIYPHRTLPLRVVPNEWTAWVAAIRERVNDLDAARREGQVLRDFVHESYLDRRWAEPIFSVWSGIPLRRDVA